MLGMGLAVELEALGFRTAGPFSSYGEVIPRLASRHPDCAVVDVGLKDGSGFEAARELRRRGIPIVLLSGAYACGPETLEAWQGTPWLGKPLAAVHLAHILDGLVRSRMPQPRSRAA